jgi:hypothetical protein
MSAKDQALRDIREELSDIKTTCNWWGEPEVWVVRPEYLDTRDTAKKNKQLTDELKRAKPL